MFLLPDLEQASWPRSVPPAFPLCLALPRFGIHSVCDGKCLVLEAPAGNSVTSLQGPVPLRNFLWQREELAVVIFSRCLYSLCLSISPCQGQVLYPWPVQKVLRWNRAIVIWSPFEMTFVRVLSSAVQYCFSFIQIVLIVLYDEALEKCWTLYFACL